MGIVAVIYRLKDLKIESYHRKFLDFEHLDREVMRDGRPVPIIRYDSEKARAEIVYFDESKV